MSRKHDAGYPLQKAGRLVSGGLQGVTNATYQTIRYNAPSSNILRDGIQGAGYGMAGGAILGGTVGGYLAARNGNNIWLGAKVAPGRTVWSLNNTPIGSAGPRGTFEVGQVTWEWPDGSIEVYSEGSVRSHNNTINAIQLTRKTFGHTFTTHGENMTNFLQYRANGSGMPQGQFLDNQKAAQFILDNLGKTANGTVNLPIPQNFPARVILPDGTFRAATHIRLVPGGGGVKTAYPLLIP